MGWSCWGKENQNRQQHELSVKARAVTAKAYTKRKVMSDMLEAPTGLAMKKKDVS
jgi:hypothetical protein